MAKKGNVLVVDDEEVMRDVLESLLSHDGYRVDLAKSGEEGLALWNMETGASMRYFDVENVYYAAAFSHDGQTALGAGYDGLCRFNVLDGNLLDCDEKFADTSLYSLAFSPDGSLLAAGGRNIYLMEYPSMKLVRKLEGHTGTIPSMRFSPDGKLLISGSEDGTARIWEISTGQILRVLTNRNALVNTVAFAPNSQSVYVGGADNTVWRMDVDVNKLIQLACSTIPHRLTEEERKKFKIGNAVETCP